jgi:hypothetical protein
MVSGLPGSSGAWLPPLTLAEKLRPRLLLKLLPSWSKTWTDPS